MLKGRSWADDDDDDAYLESLLRPYQGPPSYREPEENQRYYNAWEQPLFDSPQFREHVHSPQESPMDSPRGSHGFNQEWETDPHRLDQRRKQIAFGKNTVGYIRYTTAVPKYSRDPDNPMHPSTPDVRRKMSKRRWDATVSSWRRQLHEWDPKSSALSSSSSFATMDTDPAEVFAAAMQKLTPFLNANNNNVRNDDSDSDMYY